MERGVGAAVYCPRRTHPIASRSRRQRPTLRCWSSAYEQSQRAVDLAQCAYQRLVGSLRVGFAASATRHVLLPLIARFRQTHPDVALDLTEATTSQ
ncbi:hypothetical protein G3N96_02550 [Burkholderia sp. Se-20373]|nr:hypothetical protein [Burkholderia sp. Se-20373]